MIVLDWRTDAAVWTGPPAVVAIGALADNNSTTQDVLVPYPSGLQANDIAFIEFGSESAVGTAHNIETPTGWTQIDQRQLNDIAYFRHAVFWKRLDGTESGTVSIGVDIAHPGTHSLCGKMSVVRGAIASGTPYETPAFNTGTNVNMAGAAVTTGGPNRLVLHFCMSDNTFTSTPGGSFVEEYDVSTTSGNEDHALHLYSLAQPSAATVGPTTHTLTTSTRWQTFAFAVKPA